VPILGLDDTTLEAVSRRYATHDPRGRSRTDGLRGESRLE
jgi:hypothetical protein